MTMFDVFDVSTTRDDSAYIPGQRTIAAFQEAWSLYPHKKDRKRATASYSRARSVATHEQIMDRVRAYAESVRRGDVTAVASMSSFLERADWSTTPVARGGR